MINFTLTVIVILSFLIICNQIPYFSRNLDKYTFGLVPKWNFFAPKPGVFDFRIYYRMQETNTSISDWIEWDYKLFDRKWYNFILNPYKRKRKAVFDLCQEIANIIDYNNTNVNDAINIEYSIAYIAFLKNIEQSISNENIEAIQYGILTSDMLGKGESFSLMLISKWHVHEYTSTI
jgi:hypothetical protein